MLPSHVAVVFNISSSHLNTNLPSTRFLQEQFLVFFNLACLITLAITSTMIPLITFLNKSKSSNYLRSHPQFNFCFELYAISFNSHLNSHNSC